MVTRSRRLRRDLPLLLASVALLALAGCSSSGSGSADAAAGGSRLNSLDAPGAAAPVPANGPADGPANELDSLTDSQAFSTDSRAAAAGGKAATASDRADDPSTQAAIISTGVVSMRSRDVGDIGFDVQRILAEHQGTVDDERTQTDAQGTIERSKLVIRVPAAEFTDAMDALEKVGTLESSSRQSEDVTTQVIDNDVRIRAQEESLRRIEALLARATNIRTIISIESQLSSRQADLDSLKSTQAYLKDQTSMSTITVLMERTPEPVHTTKKKTANAGFLTGLDDGWGAFKDVAAGLALLLGRMLPFGVVLLILGIPAWLLWRRIRTQTTGPTGPAATEPAPAE